MVAKPVPVLGHPGLAVKGAGVIATDMTRYREIQRERTRASIEARVEDLQSQVTELLRRVTALEAK